MVLQRSDITAQFSSRFGSAPRWVVRAPGRVNLIGEHTDYNDGFVLPMAIERAIWIALRPRDDQRVEVYSADYREAAGFALADLQKGPAGWIEYLKGVAWVLKEAGHRLRGFDAVMQGDVPLAAGLSSSAALEVATARALAAASDLPWDAVDMALRCQRAENQWVGVNCGIMDQLISAAGREGHAVLIDCRSLEIRPAPLPSGIAVVILDTGTRRGLVDSAYNERRASCEAAAKTFGIKALRDIDVPTIQARSSELDIATLRRARHVVTENDRVLRAVEAMQAGDPASLGLLMNASHISLREDYDVSSPALNAIVELAVNQLGCYGARMTGAGFGGCAVAIVAEEIAESFSTMVAAEYRRQTGNEPALYVTRPTNGAELFDGAA